MNFKRKIIFSDQVGQNSVKFTRKHYHHFESSILWHSVSQVNIKRHANLFSIYSQKILWDSTKKRMAGIRLNIAWHHFLTPLSSSPPFCGLTPFYISANPKFCCVMLDVWSTSWIFGRWITEYLWYSKEVWKLTVWSNWIPKNR